MDVVTEEARHAARIEALLEEGFGPDRQRKTVYRLRAGVAPIAELCLVAEAEDGSLRGTLRFWPVEIAVAEGAAVAALLLGPIAVAGGLRKTGVGRLLMQAGLDRARALGHRIVLLVGDESYYGRFGFRRALAEPLSLPGPVEVERFLALDLVEGALDGISGLVRRASRGAPCRDRGTALHPTAPVGPAEALHQAMAGL
jgi:predicted N-acetyltransferase YhbS